MRLAADRVAPINHPIYFGYRAPASLNRNLSRFIELRLPAIGCWQAFHATESEGGAGVAGTAAGCLRDIATVPYRLPLQHGRWHDDRNDGYSRQFGSTPVGPTSSVAASRTTATSKL